MPAESPNFEITAPLYEVNVFVVGDQAMVVSKGTYGTTVHYVAEPVVGRMPWWGEAKERKESAAVLAVEHGVIPKKINLNPQANT